MEPMEVLDMILSGLKNSVGMKELNEFIEEVTDTINVKQYINQLIHKRPDNLEEILVILNSIYRLIYTKDATLDSVLTRDIRSVVSEVYGFNSPEHILSKKLVRLDSGLKKDLIASQNDRIIDKLSNAKVYKYSHIHEIITKLIVSKNPLEKALALLLASGSRPTELFIEAEFKRRPNIGPYWVFQDFVCKRKSSEVGLLKPIIILTSSLFIRELISVRRELGNPGRLTSTITYPLGKLSHKLLGSRCYESRAIYARISYELFRGSTNIFGKNPQLPIWVNKVLGHDSKSIETSNYYSAIEIEWDKDLHVGSNNGTKYVVKSIFDHFVNVNKKIPSQNEFEKITKYMGLPRSQIREIYKELLVC